MSEIEWKNPPPPTPRKADLVAAQLAARPGVWAKIAHETGIAFLPWWTPIANSDDYEWKSVFTTESRGLGAPRDIYARRLPTPDPAPNTAAGGVADVTTGGK